MCERSGVSVGAMSHSGVSVNEVKRKESVCHVNRNKAQDIRVDWEGQ